METAPPSPPGDDAELAEFGYRPELKRTLGNFHTFAAGISYISILTGTFQLFYFGYASGGPAYWWSWPMVFMRPVHGRALLRRTGRPLSRGRVHLQLG